ncbi:hypothetical protein F4780DRAFT_357375 [Xylariomycetidae sp. FL0641]|nr:hypothetical protein F4780DRAFT_357375 [Xylariomycetidae sp. FL0641]
MLPLISQLSGQSHFDRQQSPASLAARLATRQLSYLPASHAAAAAAAAHASQASHVVQPPNTTTPLLPSSFSLASSVELPAFVDFLRSSEPHSPGPTMDFSHTYYGGAQPYHFIGIPPLTPSHSNSAASEDFNNQSPHVRIPISISFLCHPLHFPVFQSPVCFQARPLIFAPFC